MAAKQKNKKQAIAARKIQKTSTKEKNYRLYLLMTVIISFVAYLPVFSNGLVNLDDNVYIQENPLIRSLNLSDIFSQYQQGNYHPLTMLLYAIQYKFFGLNA